MHDIRRIREDGDGFDREMRRRGLGDVADEILEADRRWRECVSTAQALRQQRNDASREIGRRKREGEDADELIGQVARIRSEAQRLEETAHGLEAGLRDLLAGLPNSLAREVPDGRDETENLEIRRCGELPAFDFLPKDHVAIGAGLGLMDFGRAARLSGARFVFLTGMLARLERALAAFMLDRQAGHHGYLEVSPPFMVHEQALFGTGQLPKFADQQYRTEDGLWLIPTSEVPLTNLVADEILDAADLPLRFTAHTPCFRSEAGAAGQDTRGMIRMHQFTKVEMVSICHPDEAQAEHERMTACAEDILHVLGLPFRTVLLCSGDTGFAARKTYDIEVWLPGQDEGSGRYREISSCSDCGDFQARRMKARFRHDGVIDHPCTLNGSGLAVGRTLIAVLENFQRADGSIVIPEALRPWIGGVEVIAPGDRTP